MKLLKHRLPHMGGGVSRQEILSSLQAGLPMGGGVSIGVAFRCLAEQSSTWVGVFLSTSPTDHSRSVFPTWVGVFLNPTQNFTARFSLPHMGGGVSQHRGANRRRVKSSPHGWVFLISKAFLILQFGLPHMGGGVSQHRVPTDESEVFPTWVGVFLQNHEWVCMLCVFPTWVGVFPKKKMFLL